jgi:colicin import membrane protein
MNAIEARERRNAVGAAIVMHLALLAALLVSLNWTREARQPVQAELWAAPPGDLPRAVTPPPPETRAPAVPLPPLPLPAPPAKADISLEKPPVPKKEPPKKADPPRKTEPPKKAEPPRKTEPKKVEPKKTEPPKKITDSERKRQEADRKQAEERTARQLQEQRQSELSRLGLDPAARQDAQGKDAVSRTGVASGAEIGARTGIDADYEALIQARIKARINYPDRSPGNPEAVVLVEQLPSGEVSAVRLLRPSGMPAWDAAVQRAIWAASPLPKRKDGSVARVLELGFRPRETR